MKQTELITNSDNSIFHLHLKSKDIADKVIVVGDPGRVELVASLLDTIKIKKANREFHTITGGFKGKEITIVSSGIGTDNIDILINELDAAVNYDLSTRQKNSEHRTLEIVRLGTAGGLQAEIEPGSYIVSRKAIGFDNVLNFYAGIEDYSDLDFEQQLMAHLDWPLRLSTPYVIDADSELLSRFKQLGLKDGFTISTPGFYAPQGRRLSLDPYMSDINDRIETFRYKGDKIYNYEMESSAIYGLSKMLKHKALTICSVIGNRVSGKFLNDYRRSILNLSKIVVENI
jgi:uridine phosphorylase